MTSFDLSKRRVLDLSQNFSIDSPPFAFYEGPTIGMPMDEAFPWPRDYQATHTMLFPKGVFHVENVGGHIDLILNQRVWVGCFPFRFKGGEAAFCRFVAFVQA